MEKITKISIRIFKHVKDDMQFSNPITAAMVSINVVDILQELCRFARKLYAGAIVK